VIRIKYRDNKLGVCGIPRVFHKAGLKSFVEPATRKDKYFAPNRLNALVVPPAEDGEAAREA
jgi:hypothetical protein